MRILILGADGMLGHKLCQLMKEQYDVFATVRESELGVYAMLLANEFNSKVITGIDAADFKMVKKAVLETEPRVVINCIGIVKQRNEAKDAISSILINSLFPHQLAQLCTGNNIRLIHVSTDCIFSGLKGGYRETDIPDPVDLYGRSKLLGEIDQPGCLTLRTSIIGWELKHRKSLLEWFASKRGETIKGFRRAIYSGLSTAVLAKLIIRLINEHENIDGLYHVSSDPISKCELLSLLKTALGWDDIVIEPDDEFLCDRSLNSSNFMEKTGWSPPSWKEIVSELAEEWPLYEKWRNLY